MHEVHINAMTTRVNVKGKEETKVFSQLTARAEASSKKLEKTKKGRKVNYMDVRLATPRGGNGIKVRDKEGEGKKMVS